MAVVHGAHDVRRAVFGALVALVCAVTAGAPVLAEPVDYPEILLDLPPPPPDDLKAFIESAIEATRLGGSSHMKAMDRLEAHFSDDVRLYVGAVELTDGDNFDLIDVYPNWTFMRRLGDLASYRSLFIDEEEELGAERLREMLETGVVGANPWMHDEMCTAAYGKLDDKALRDLLRQTGTQLSQWRIAASPWRQAGFLGETGLFEWRVGQLLLVDMDAPKPDNCCWDYVSLPDRTGGYIARSRHHTPLTSYLNSHVCFGRDKAGAWKITGVGYRTP